jgi:hypothetical protein
MLHQRRHTHTHTNQNRDHKLIKRLFAEWGDSTVVHTPGSSLFQTENKEKRCHLSDEKKQIKELLWCMVCNQTSKIAIISSQEAMHEGCHVVLLYDACALLRVKNCSTTLAAGSGAIAGSSDCVKPSACHSPAKLSPGHTCTTIPPLLCPPYIVGWPLLHLACPGPLVLPARQSCIIIRGHHLTAS